ncbi:hypothetical protein DL93DRAFT_2144038 [Clavulina sp. PMI_390]|nr:hypothetical protein DL93DRAFT_2144038 [Clavulina sp. PMI_390]
MGGGTSEPVVFGLETPILKVDGPASDDVEASSACPTRFMTATWVDDPEMTRKGGKCYWAYLHDRVRYKGPQVPRQDKLAIQSYWSQHAFVFPRVAAPMVLQYISMRFLNYSWPWPLAFVLYSFSFLGFSDDMANEFNRLSEEHGFLDGEKLRDNIPDGRLASTSISTILIVTVRPLLGCFLAYKRQELPHVDLWTPVHMFIYTCLIDFWYYVYHRAMHEVDFLWRFHKTHHMTKHPCTTLAILADPVQSFCDMIVIPLISFKCHPMSFHVWWMTTVYLFYIEAVMHAGTRLYWTSPVTGPILEPLGMELVLEDHDLHHRNGWGKASNYGKQTRIWDVLFGTTRSRLEMVPENIDWNQRV